MLPWRAVAQVRDVRGLDDPGQLKLAAGGIGVVEQAVARTEQPLPALAQRRPGPGPGALIPGRSLKPPPFGPLVSGGAASTSSLM